MADRACAEIPAGPALYHNLAGLFPVSLLSKPESKKRRNTSTDILHPCSNFLRVCCIWYRSGMVGGSEFAGAQAISFLKLELVSTGCVSGTWVPRISHCHSDLASLEASSGQS